VVDLGQAGKEGGMRRADEHANAAWKDAIDIAIIQTAIALRELTTDDVLKRVTNNVWTHEMRALGPRMAQAARNKLIVKSNKPAVMTARPSNHRRPLQVWESLIYKGGSNE
jgi:hypothetical protein